jgi:hypothetical protein
MYIVNLKSMQYYHNKWNSNINIVEQVPITHFKQNQILDLNTMKRLIHSIK